MAGDIGFAAAEDGGLGVASAGQDGRPQGHSGVAATPSARFQFDASGYVDGAPLHIPSGVVWSKGRTYWGDLTPFQQGYAEALISSVQIDPRGKWPGVSPVSGLEALGFSYLAPETLARIREYCEAVSGPLASHLRTAVQGRDCWRARAAGLMSHPAETPYLGDDGKVYLREAS